MNRTTLLIEQFLYIQNNVLKLYKNASKIEGQYNPGVKTATNVLANLYEKKISLYKIILSEAAEKNK